MIDDLRPLASISSWLSFVYEAVSETLPQLRYEQQWFSALIQWERPPLPCSGEESGEGARKRPGISQQPSTFRPDQRLMRA